ncbi:bZIP transcription factor 1 [Phytophthora ramorum]|uniref:bZIP transcription factor 1 n=1 Tax=Phytophthora ramorum TaxID=164328 RepID=UPI0030952100|nr:bZIP transcription factor 1 [Phytophthora ramorum]
MHTRPMLSSEIVRPVFRRQGKEDTIDNDSTYIETPQPLERRLFSHAVPSSAARAPRSSRVYSPPVAEEKYQPEPQMVSTSTAFDSTLNLVLHRAGRQPHKSGSKRIRLKSERRREQCRVNQARYRQRQLNHIMTIKHDVQKLRADIHVVELQRNRLQYGGQQGVWNVVVEYFRNFRFGVPITLSETSADEEACNTLKLPEYADNAEAKHQLAFLRSCMAEDVSLGERCGVETLMQQWQAYSLSFKNLHFELKRIERTSRQFVHAVAKMTVTVSETTFKSLFPHVNSASLRTRLVGQRLELPCTLCFEWDESAGRVSRLETTVNFMAPLLKALGDVSDVALLLESARITRDGAVGIRDA